MQHVTKFSTCGHTNSKTKGPLEYFIISVHRTLTMLSITVGYSSPLCSMIFGTLVSRVQNCLISLYLVHHTMACVLEMEMTYKNFNHTELCINNATWNIHTDPERKHSKYTQCLNISYSYEKVYLFF